MQKDALNNVHITDEQVLMTPEQLKAEFPLSQEQEAQIAQSRKTISDIISGRDPRLLVVCGPCSIHDPEMAIEYARRFKALAAEVSDSLYLVMRVYFEKPRTTVGWKGLINDPHMDGSFDVEAGLKIARQLLLELVNMGLPLATEALDQIARNTRAICLAGPQSEPVLRNRRLTAKWLPVFPCRSALRMVLTVVWRPPLMPCVRLRSRTALLVLIRPGRLRCCKLRGIRMAT